MAGSSSSTQAWMDAIVTRSTAPPQLAVDDATERVVLDDASEKHLHLVDEYEAGCAALGQEPQTSEKYVAYDVKKTGLKGPHIKIARTNVGDGTLSGHDAFLAAQKKIQFNFSQAPVNDDVEIYRQSWNHALNILRDNCQDERCMKLYNLIKRKIAPSTHTDKSTPGAWMTTIRIEHVMLYHIIML